LVVLISFVASACVAKTAAEIMAVTRLSRPTRPKPLTPTWLMMPRTRPKPLMLTRLIMLRSPRPMRDYEANEANEAEANDTMIQWGWQVDEANDAEVSEAN
jgi:hypothetical protein